MLVTYSQSKPPLSKLAASKVKLEMPGKSVTCKGEIKQDSSEPLMRKHSNSQASYTSSTKTDPSLCLGLSCLASVMDDSEIFLLTGLTMLLADSHPCCRVLPQAG